MPRKYEHCFYVSTLKMHMAVTQAVRGFGFVYVMHRDAPKAVCPKNRREKPEHRDTFRCSRVETTDSRGCIENRPK